MLCFAIICDVYAIFMFVLVFVFVFLSMFMFMLVLWYILVCHVMLGYVMSYYVML